MNDHSSRTGQGIAVFLATGFYSGYFPIAPGTIGTVVAIPIYLALRFGGDLAVGIGFAVMTIVAIVSSSAAEEHFGKKDPSAVVIDEIAGMLLTMLFIPFSWKALLAGFLLFRVSDILKPFPGRRCEKLPGGWGIVLDDLVAALYANIAVRLLIFFHVL